MINEQILIENFKQEFPQSNMHKPNNVYEALKILSENNIYEESNIIENSENKYYLESALEKIKESIYNDNKVTWRYPVSPYFTPEEIEQFKNYYSESSGTQFNPKSIYKKNQDIKNRLNNTNDPDEIDDIKNDLDALASYSGESENVYNEFNYKEWNESVSYLCNKLKTEENVSKIDEIKQQIVNLGWNPEIEYNKKNQIKAKKRIESLYQERNRFITIDISSIIENYYNTDNECIINEGAKSDLKPIYVILVYGNTIPSGIITKYTNSEFSHSAICIDNNFDKCYSYNLFNKANFNGGFSIEKIKEYPNNSRLAVFAIFISKDDQKKISNRINELLDNIQNTSYSFLNIFTMPFKNINFNFDKSMVCSQFVDSILKLINIDINNKNSAKVAPGDFYKNAKNKMYKVFDGIVKDFDQNKIINYVNKMSNKHIINKESYNIIDEYIYPSILETKSLIDIDKNGDVLIRNKFIDFDLEYSSSHKLLLQYEKTNNLNGMKYELARLYYMNYILERKIYHNKFLKNKIKNINTRARILNDFNKYIKYVNTKEPDFNFSEYYEKSIFYPHTIEIKSDTILKLKDIIKYILQ